jgi:hypothetical protein
MVRNLQTIGGLDGERAREGQRHDHPKEDLRDPFHWV